jgi:hypothetical protein
MVCAADLNGDGQVNGADIAIVLSNCGPCPAGLGSVEPAVDVQVDHPAGALVLDDALTYGSGSVPA